MKIINTILLALIAMLILVMIAKGEAISKSEADSDYISWVKIYTGRYISDTNIQPILNDLKVVRGVAKVDAEPENRFLIVTPKKDEKLNLKSIQKAVQRLDREHIDRGKSFLPYSNKVEIVAQGSLIKVPVGYSFSVAERIRHSHDRYKFQVGDTELMLSQNGKLDELIKSGYNRVRIEGIIVAFTKRIPIMVVADFEPAGPGEKSMIVKRMEGSGQSKTPNIASLLGTMEYKCPKCGMIYDKLGNCDMDGAKLVAQTKIPKKGEQSGTNTIRVYIDGIDNCSKCADHIKEALQKEVNANIVNVDSEMGFVDIVPKENEKFDLYNLGEKISKMGPYTVIKIEIVTSGIVTESNVNYGNEAHKRYTLSAGKHTNFILIEDDKLNELLKSGDKSVTVIGTVSSYDKNIPVLEINDFQKHKE